MRTKSDSADKVYSNRQTLRDCFRLRVLYTGKTKNSHLKQSLNVCLSVDFSSLSVFYSLERRTLLEKQTIYLEDFLHWSILYYILSVTKNHYLLVVQSMLCYNLELIGNLESLFLEDFLHWSILYYILLVTKNYYLLVVQSMFCYNLELIGNLESLFRVHILSRQMIKVIKMRKLNI